MSDVGMDVGMYSLSISTLVVRAVRAFFMLFLFSVYRVALHFKDAKWRYDQTTSFNGLFDGFFSLSLHFHFILFSCCLARSFFSKRKKSTRSPLSLHHIDTYTQHSVYCTVPYRVLLLLFVWFWLLFYDLLLFVYIECVFECHCPVVSIAEFNQKAIFIRCPLSLSRLACISMPSLMAIMMKKKKKIAKMKRIRFGNKFVRFALVRAKCGLESGKCAKLSSKNTNFKKNKAEKKTESGLRWIFGAATEFTHFPFNKCIWNTKPNWWS